MDLKREPMRTNRIEHWAKLLLIKHGLNDYSFEWNRAKKILGQHFGFKKVIFLSYPITKGQDFKKVKNTLLHEIAHAIDYKERGFSKHDLTWQRIAKSIGSSGNRCGQIEKPLSFNHVYKCESCKLEIGTYRRLKNLDKRYHSACYRKGKQGKLVKIK